MNNKNIFGVFSGLIAMTQVILVNAEDGELEFETEDSAELFGQLGIGFYIAALIMGIVIWLTQQKPIQMFFKEKQIKLPMKLIWKIHHPLTFIAFGCWLIHGLLNQFGGEVEDGNFIGWVAVITMSILMVSGFFFKLFKGPNRNIMRIIHFGLMVAAGIFLAMHSASVDD